jgi:indole-3-glycerol phosphate synthase
VNVLAEIVATTRSGIAERRAFVSEAKLVRLGEERDRIGDRRSFHAALARDGLSLIAEHKRRSPSAGVIREGVGLGDVVGAYQRGGAAALSVLTETTRFGGTLGDLRVARGASSLPILRKDFVVDPYQVHEALAGGADAILLIVAALDPAQLRSLHELARSLGLDVLVEVHDAGELDVANQLGASIVGINNRDLATLKVDTERTFELLGDVRKGALVVAESGFRGRAELERLAAASVDAVLIGEALMRADDIEAACRELTGVGSSVAPDTP